MRGVIRLGDHTDRGCRVITASESSKVADKGVARIGDRCLCGEKDRHECVIVEGNANVKVHGKPVAFDGHRTSCGAALISTMPTSGTSA
ncbi:MAG: PAAR domain-containing protein [Trinickia sp.]|uniref:PAAR domain-containing protein n=1 Tax=Trinickia sp. TaxID=2571163 RepID=UPI003F7F7991